MNMTTKAFYRIVRAAVCFSVSVIANRIPADTILTCDNYDPPPWHVNPVPQTFGDFGKSGNPADPLTGLTVTGLGTPDIDLTWSVTGNPNNDGSSTNVWWYWAWPTDRWNAFELRGSDMGIDYDLKFQPANSAKVVVKSFNFHGWYGIVNISGVNYQERFTYNWSVRDAGSLASLASGTYSFLSDTTKNHPVSINYTGTNGQALILRLTRTPSTLDTGGDPIEVEGMANNIAVDDITFSEETTNTASILTGVSPADGETNVAPGFAYRATIVESSAAPVTTNSVQLKLDGVALPPVIARTGAETTISFSAGGLLRSGSKHKYTLSFETGGSSPASTTNEVTFYVQRYTSYEWRFTQGDLTTDLGNGTMSYVVDAAGTTFGTTDGSSVPHIGGNVAKYMHVPGFTSDADGYWLTFDDSGPNVGTNAYINRYTLFFDVLIPSPWPVNEYIVPFFNTDPYNLNDGDFYLYSDGELGIGGGGYAPAGTITPDTWCRIAFVADIAANTLTYYVNGTKVKTRSGGGLGGTWSLYSNQDVGAYPLYPANLLLFNEGDTSGIYTHDVYLSSVAFTDRAISAGEASTLGSPGAGGILVPSFASAPMLASQQSANGAVISWPTQFVGYALESKTDLASSTWAPVPCITNNSVNIPAGVGSQFFRLMQ